MVNIHLAYSEPINPAGSKEVLTREQVWKGLQRKIRHAQDFVPIITSTDIVEDKGNEVTRVAHFVDRGDGKSEVREVCKSYYPVKVDFHQPDGTLITNTVSDGLGGDDNALIMTYTFEFSLPDVEEGSDQHKEMYAKHKGMAKNAVHSSIEALHKMGAAGELD